MKIWYGLINIWSNYSWKDAIPVKYNYKYIANTICLLASAFVMDNKGNILYMFIFQIQPHVFYIYMIWARQNLTHVFYKKNKNIQLTKY